MFVNVSKKVLAGCAVGAVGLLLGGMAIAAGQNDNWTSAGHDLKNTRYQNNETTIGVGNVGGLGVKWTFTVGLDVSATPAVDSSNVYVPDWAGNLYAVNRATGAQVWSKPVSQYTGVAGDLARATPVVASNRLILGDQRNFGNLFADSGAFVFAVDKNTGAPLWRTKVDDHYSAIVTQSAVVDGNVAYVGVSSREEALAAFGFPCCSFRGSFLALDVNTGKILWKTYMVPAGWTGGAVWGSTAAVDNARKTVYITTGNNYTAPQSALDCVDAATTPEAKRACLPADDYFDSVLALDAATGAVKWVTQALPFDAWNVDCIPFFGDGSNCPEPAGPDYDFGQGPALFDVKAPGGKRRDLVGAGQKSGQYWALDADTGAVVWVTQTGPGGTAGGLQWGSAVDGTRIYTANANSDGKSWELVQNGVGTGVTTRQGIWSALDAATGKILWQTVPPNGGGASGPATTANGVVYGCALDPVGHMVAMNAATGSIVWDYASGGSCLSGGAISQGTVYWGSGYSNFGFGTPNNKLYAFSLNGS
jgi:polyvinyl alcohol dehydrogenase (cytochrome)